MDYLRDPEAIYAKSFATIEAEARLDRFGALERQVSVRVIHGCGMVEIADDLAFSTGAVAAGVAAIRAGASIICDVRMVEHGILARHLCGNPVHVAIAQEHAAEQAQRLGTTRSAGGIEALKSEIEGAVVAVGNAPTALFHLLEGLQRGWPKPALVLGFPVGFVGAAESKQALITQVDVPFAALKGRRGGSAMAAAALNAILIEAGK